MAKKTPPPSTTEGVEARTRRQKAPAKQGSPGPGASAPRGAARGRKRGAGKAGPARKERASPTAPIELRCAPPRGEYEALAGQGYLQNELTPGLLTEMCGVIRERGIGLEKACVLLGVSENTRRNWVARGRADIEAGRAHSLHGQFLALVTHARETLFADLTWLRLRLALGDEGVRGNFEQLGAVLGQLFPEAAFEVQRHVTETLSKALKRLKEALPPDEYLKALKAITEQE